MFPEGVVYAPSAAAYAFCCMKKAAGSPQRALVASGDASSLELGWEIDQIADALLCPATVVSRLTELSEAAPESDIVYIATHGRSPAERPDRPDDESEWELLFDGGRIGAADFFSGRIRLKRGSLVILSACGVGRVMPGQAHELHGLLRALFYAGAATVLAARWPILNKTTIPVFVGTLERVFPRRQLTMASALRNSVAAASQRSDLRELMAGPDADPFFWGSFALFGCGN